MLSDADTPTDVEVCTTWQGPIARKDLRDELHQQVVDSVDAGAMLTIGGDVPDCPGFFYPVTVLEYVSPEVPACDDQLFGPVVSIIRVVNENEAIRVAHDSRLGLGLVPFRPWST